MRASPFNLLVPSTPYSKLAIGIPRESYPRERRVALTPANTALLKKGFARASFLTPSTFCIDLHNLRRWGPSLRSEDRIVQTSAARLICSKGTRAPYSHSP